MQVPILFQNHGAQPNELNKAKMQVNAPRINTFWESPESFMGSWHCLERGAFKFQATHIWAYFAWVLKILPKVSAHAAVCEPHCFSIWDQTGFPIDEYSSSQDQGIPFICYISCSTPAFVTELINEPDL